MSHVSCELAPAIKLMSQDGLPEFKLWGGYIMSTMAKNHSTEGYNAKRSITRCLIQSCYDIVMEASPATAMVKDKCYPTIYFAGL